MANWWFPLMLTSLAQLEVQYEHVAEYVSQCLRNIPVQCPLVVGHDISGHFPSPLTNLMTAQQQLGRPVLADNGDPPVSPVGRELKRPKCALLLVTFTIAKFNSSLDQLVDYSQVIWTRKTRDLFVFWVRDDLSESRFLLDEFFTKVKYKVAVRFDQRGSLEGHTVCFYCNSGNPVLQQLESHTNAFQDMTLDLQGKVLEGLNEIAVTPANCSDWRVFIAYHICFLHQVLNFTWKMMAVDLNNQEERVTAFEKLLTGEMSFALYFMHSWEYYQAVDFIGFHDIGRLRFIVRNPRTHHSLLVFVRPFTPLIWLLIFLSVVMVSAVSAFIEKHYPETNRSKRRSLLKQLGRTSMALVEQYPVPPEYSSYRLVLISWVLFAFIIGVGYKTKLFSLLLMLPMESVPTKIRDVPGSGYDVMYEQSLYELYRKLGGGKELVKILSDMFVHGRGLDSVQDCIRATLEGNKICLSTEYRLRKEADMAFQDGKGGWKVMLSSDSILHFSFSMVFPRDSVYSDSFDRYVGVYNSIGISVKGQRLSHHLKAWDHARTMQIFSFDDPSSHTEQKEGKIKFSLEILQGAFYILVEGSLISSVVFASEVLRTRSCPH